MASYCCKGRLWPWESAPRTCCPIQKIIIKIKLFEFLFLLTLLYLLAQEERSQELIMCALIVDSLDEVAALLEHLDLIQLVTLCLLCGLALLDKLVEVWYVELVLLRRAADSTDELAQLHNVKLVHLVLLLFSLELF